MSSRKSTPNKILLQGVGIFGPIRASMAKNNHFLPVGSKIFKATPKMQYAEYLNDSGRILSIKDNLVSPFVVRVETKDSTYDD
jgi:hypothetical protein